MYTDVFIFTLQISSKDGNLVKELNHFIYISISA